MITVSVIVDHDGKTLVAASSRITDEEYLSNSRPVSFRNLVVARIRQAAYLAVRQVDDYEKTHPIQPPFIADE